jgi:polar amino acid transport system ATP-binding protein
MNATSPTPSEDDRDEPVAVTLQEVLDTLESGKIEEQGPPASLFGNPQSDRLRGFLSATAA